MNQSNSSKQVLLSVIGVAILVVAVVGVSFAFFNYTRTGSENTISTGQILFNSSQTTLGLSNVFPIAAGDVATDSANTSTATVTISGTTTYSGGLDYRVTVQESDLTIGTGNSAFDLPVSVVVSQTGLNSGSNTVTLAAAGANVADDLVLAEGFIASSGTTAGSNTVNGTITIKAYLDASEIAITDTPQGGSYGGATAETGYIDSGNGTTSSWISGRQVLTTSQWNGLASDNATFKIRVEAKQHSGNYAYNPS